MHGGNSITRPSLTQRFVRIQSAVSAGCVPGVWLPLLTAVVILLSVATSATYQWVHCPVLLAPDEAHYWDWSRNLDWSYYSKGPLVAWLIRGSCELFGSLSLRLTGDLAAAVRLPTLFCHAAILTGWYVLASGVFRSPKLGLAVVALAASMPVIRIASVVMTIDPPFLAFWCWGLVCVRNAIESERTHWWVGAAACTAVGILAKYTMLLFPLAVAGFLLVHQRDSFRRIGVWILFAGALLGWLPIVVWNSQHDWVSFRHVFRQVGTGGTNEGGVKWSGPFEFLAGQLGVLFGLWLVAFLAAAWRFRSSHCRNSGIQLLWWTSIPVWIVFVCASLVKSGQPNWPAPAYIGGFILAVAWVGEQLCKSGRHHVIRCLVGNTAIGLIGIFAVQYPAVVRPILVRVVSPATDSDPIPVRRVEISARLLGWKALASEIDALRARIRLEKGHDPVLAGTYWTIPGQLRFYCDGHPDAYTVGIPNRSDRHSQYDFWRPNPGADAQEFQGRTFLIVGDIGPHMLRAFLRVEPPRQVTYVEGGVVLERWTVWVCHGFRGFDAAAEHDPGY